MSKIKSVSDTVKLIPDNATYRGEFIQWAVLSLISYLKRLVKRFDAEQHLKI